MMFFTNVLLVLHLWTVVLVAWTPPLSSPIIGRSNSALKNVQQKQDFGAFLESAAAVKEGSNNSNNSTARPFRTVAKKLDHKIQEIEQKDRSGENLTQAYCDSVLGLCVASDQWESVLEVLEIMKRQGLTQERSSYRACLQACFEAGNGGSAKEILAAMEKALVKPEPSDIALTVAALCRRNNDNSATTPGWWRRALVLLTTTSMKCKSNKDVIPVQAYNAVLECMVEERQWKEAVRLLRLMEEGSSDKTSAGRKKYIGYHPAPDISTYREVIECAVGGNQAEQAVQVLYSMKDKGVKPSTHACELVISALSRRLQWRRAIELLDLMTQMEIPKTVVAYNTVISSCARSREVGMAKNLLSRMRKDGIRPDVVSFNSVIGACANTARWKDALTVLDQCYREPGVTPNIYTYTNAMRACAKGGETKRALNLLQVVKDKGLPLDSYIYTAVIDACAKARLWKKALSLLDEMQKKGIEPSEVTYSVTISACGNGGQWRKALDLLNLMREKGMSVNLITYNAGITALSKAARMKRDDPSFNPVDSEDLWSRAMLLLGQMKEDGIEPDGFCYSSAISCCGAEGRWEEALKLIQIMKRGGPRTRPNKIAYTAAISACGRAGESKHALELFQSMKDEGHAADRVAYNSLFSALRVGGNADKAFELWGEICGTRSTSKAAKDIATPDIITVTDCMATLSRAERLTEVDQVFREAVQRGIVLRGNALDSQWETDLTGMSFPVARAAIRYILKQCLEEDWGNLQEITFITGVGGSHKLRGNNNSFSKASSSKPSSLMEKNPRTSLRDYVQGILQNDFEPPLESIVPQWAQGTVEVNKLSLIKWLKGQEPG